ncbi:class I SAM-dependent methyltransferase [Peribacillus sp. SCS-155]|uniref:class I SAM-dependent methyltransferase n=1 Tax=Peribacillus sedimenti TaxID=3115297 RepID=UPI0039066150
MLEIFAKQFWKPDGVLGRLTGKKLLHTNKKVNRWTIDQLEVKPGDKILEIGYIGSFAASQLLKENSSIQIHGIEPAHTDGKIDDRQNQQTIPDYNFRIYKGDIFSLEVALNHYDKVMSIDNYLFWHQKRKSLVRLHHLMKEKGKIAIAVHPSEKDASNKKIFSHALQIEQDLFYAGFREIAVAFKKIKTEITVCVTGVCTKKH